MAQWKCYTQKIVLQQFFAGDGVAFHHTHFASFQFFFQLSVNHGVSSSPLPTLVSCQYSHYVYFSMHFGDWTA